MLYVLTVSLKVPTERNSDWSANIRFSEGYITCFWFNTFILKLEIIISTCSISMWRNAWEIVRQIKFDETIHYRDSLFSVMTVMEWLPSILHKIQKKLYKNKNALWLISLNRGNYNWK